MIELILSALQTAAVNITTNGIVALVARFAATVRNIVRADRGRHSSRGRRIAARRRGRHSRR